MKSVLLFNVGSGHFKWWLSIPLLVSVDAGIQEILISGNVFLIYKCRSEGLGIVVYNHVERLCVGTEFRPLEIAPFVAVGAEGPDSAILLGHFYRFRKCAFLIDHQSDDHENIDE